MEIEERGGKCGDWEGGGSGGVGGCNSNHTDCNPDYIALLCTSYILHYIATLFTLLNWNIAVEVKRGMGKEGDQHQSNRVAPKIETSYCNFYNIYQ